MRIINSLIAVAFGFTMLLPTACNRPKHIQAGPVDVEALQDTLQVIADSYPAEIGVAVIIDNTDTISVNNDLRYPMMSVFKLHQGIASCRLLDEAGISIDSVLSIPREYLNPATWSPMLKEHKEDTLALSYRQLLAYAVEQSDNNASNYLFENLISPDGVDNFIAEIIPRDGFQIRFSEDMMQSEHHLAYENRTTPLSAATLINDLYNDSTLYTAPYSDVIREQLEACQTGTDRIPAPLQHQPGVTIAHKTGSGFRDNGILTAHNDVAYIRLSRPERTYSLAVFIKDFDGEESEASEIIARISKVVYDFLAR